jgi:release factor glutamine methyltransferase
MLCAPVKRWTGVAAILCVCAKLPLMQRSINPEDVRGRWQTVHDKQPYTSEIDGIQLVVGKGVFPPDDTIIPALIMQTLSEFEPQIALDMGCGSGLLAVHMHRLGADAVYAIDRHRAAIECTRDNAVRNGISDMRVIQSDLFENVPRNVRFDLIAFTPFCEPSDFALFGPAHDGGAQIIERFFERITDFIVPNGAVVMAHNSAAGARNDPAALARARGFEVEEATMIEDRRGAIKIAVIYPISAADG